MKNKVILLIIIFSNLLFHKLAFSQTRDNSTCNDLGPVSLPEYCDFNNYELVFGDDFNGSNLDLSKWVPAVGVNRDFNFGQAKQFFKSENITVNNGTVKLTARKDQSTHTYWIPDYPYSAQSYFEYSAAEMNSKYKFKYGKYEIRCKLPEGKGLWPAFWLYGEDSQYRSEIDVIDDIDGIKASIPGFYNINYGFGSTITNTNVGKWCRYNAYPTNDLSDWQTYTLIFEPNIIIFQLNYRTLASFYRYYNTTGMPKPCLDGQPSLERLSFPKLSMGIIPTLTILNGNDAPNNSVTFPTSVEIDYIHYYKKVDCSTDKNFPTTTALNLDPAPEAYNYICGRIITAGGSNDVIVDSPKNLVLHAKNEIKLLPGFNSKKGCVFTAKLSPISFSVHISGPAVGFENTTYTWVANATNGIQPYTYNWSYSYDGNNYTNLNLNSSTFSAQLPQGNDLYLMVTVVTSDGKSSTDYFHTMNRTKARTLIDEPNILKMNIFPNPTNGVVNIEFPEDLDYKNYKLIITNVLGQNIISKDILNSKEEFNLTNFNKGLYILKLIDTKNSFCSYNKITLK